MIKQTSNYNQFKLIEGNRNIDRGHLNRLITSITKRNLLAQNPIMVNEKMQVIDGQHRLKAAASLQVPIYYIVVNKLSLQDVQLLNHAMRAWKLEDFLKSFVTLELEEYKTFKDFIEKYDLPVSVGTKLLAPELSSHAGLEAFRSGNLEITNLAEAEKYGEWLTDIRKYAPGLYRATRFIEAVMMMFRLDNYDHERMKEKLIMAGEVKPQISRHDYLRELERIYNWKAMPTAQVRFF